MRPASGSDELGTLLNAEDYRSGNARSASDALTLAWIHICSNSNLLIVLLAEEQTPSMENPALSQRSGESSSISAQTAEVSSVVCVDTLRFLPAAVTESHVWLFSGALEPSPAGRCLAGTLLRHS
ncbi:hypothetical protein AOLI_G00053580 [Acnodon oligacanthus]